MLQFFDFPFKIFNFVYFNVYKCNKKIYIKI